MIRGMKKFLVLGMAAALTACGGRAESGVTDPQAPAAGGVGGGVLEGGGGFGGELGPTRPETRVSGELCPGGCEEGQACLELAPALDGGGLGEPMAATCAAPCGGCEAPAEPDECYVLGECVDPGDPCAGCFMGQDVQACSGDEDCGGGQACLDFAGFWGCWWDLG